MLHSLIVVSDFCTLGLSLATDIYCYMFPLGNEYARRFLVAGFVPSVIFVTCIPLNCFQTWLLLTTLVFCGGMLLLAVMILCAQLLRNFYAIEDLDQLMH